MSNSWILAGAAPALPYHGAVNISGEQSLLWKGCVEIYQMEMLPDLKAESGSRVSLERGTSWSTSGPVSESSSQRGMEGMVSYKGQLVSVIYAQHILLAASFSSRS